MITTIYKRALKVLMSKPFRLWGISLLNIVLTAVFSVLFGLALGVSLAINVLMNTAMTMIYLRGYRGEEVHVTNLFDCFKDWNTIKRVVCGMGWSWLWIFLWCLIPIVGPIFGIIRSYQYRLVPYILVMEPDIAITEATKVSTERTQGYKGKMWLAEFLLGVIVAAISLVLSLLSAIPYIGFLFGVVNFLFTLAYAALGSLLVGLIQAAFYEEITNPTMPVAPVAPVYMPYAPAEPAQDPVVTPVEPVTTSYCPNCGTPLDPGSSFCHNCGHKIG